MPTQKGSQSHQDEHWTFGIDVDVRYNSDESWSFSCTEGCFGGLWSMGVWARSHLSISKPARSAQTFWPSQARCLAHRASLSYGWRLAQLAQSAHSFECRSPSISAGFGEEPVKDSGLCYYYYRRTRRKIGIWLESSTPKTTSAYPGPQFLDRDWAYQSEWANDLSFGWLSELSQLTTSGQLAESTSCLSLLSLLSWVC